MAVKEGYKQTEVGVIPEDWEVVKLGDVIEEKPTYGINAVSVPYDSNLPTYIRITDISEDGRFIKKNRTSVIYSDYEKYQLKENDIVFARTGATTGKSYLYDTSDGELVYAGFLIRIRINEDVVVPKYIKACVETAKFNEWVIMTSMRSGQPGINGNEYASFKMPIPPLPEQKAIATALSDIDGLINSLTKLIEKKKNIKQGAMQDLLTGKKRLDGYSGEWIELKIGEICEKIIDNRGKTPPLTNKGIPLLETNTIKDDLKYPLYEYVSKYVTNNTYKTWFRDHIKKGDILVSTVGMVGETALLSDYKCAIAQNLIGLRISKFAVVDFVFYLTKMPTFKKQVKAVLMGAVQPSLKVPHLLNFYIKLPKSEEEQTAIATTLSDMDSEIETLHLKLDKYKTIKLGMMQELLIGRIRLLEGA